MVWACLLSFIPEGCRDACNCIYEECANEICPLFGRSFIEYLNNLSRRLRRNEGPENADQTQNQTKSQANTSQPGNQTERQANSGQPQGQTESQANTSQPGNQTERQANSGQPQGQTESQANPQSQTNPQSQPNPSNLLSQLSPSSQSGPPNPPNPSDLPIIIARDLKIEHLDNNKYWDLILYPNEPRFKEVAELLLVWFFYIETSMNFLELSANTKYCAYLIFRTKPEPESKGLNAILKVWFSAGTEKGTKYVCLKPTKPMPSSVESPKMRPDGWMELELAQFSCDEVTGAKEASIYIKDETEGKNEKKGLIIAGIEFRPV